MPEAVQGRSLVPLLSDPSGRDWKSRPAYSVMGNKKAVQRSIRTERYRYSRYTTGEEELYDHDNDPEEFTNQASNPEYASTLRSLRARKWMKSRRGRIPSGRLASTKVAIECRSGFIPRYSYV